ncbi:MAG TPA: hypothetical protein VMG31_01560 [Verrucomicrobiae bacterium]|nr:hypothetical protein [Verrucomicrobiae bacterium]
MTTLFSNPAVSAVASVDAAPVRKKHSWLPLLTVLFLISYGLMTMLIVEQGSTIESQRALIRELFRDSMELSAVKMKAQQEKALSDGAKTQASTANPKAQNQSPLTQVPADQAPSSQVAPRSGTQNQAVKPKQRFQLPSKPVSDPGDARRALITI